LAIIEGSILSPVLSTDSAESAANHLRSVLASDDIAVVVVNDVSDKATLARLLRYDSTFGPLGLDVATH